MSAFGDAEHESATAGNTADTSSPTNIDAKTRGDALNQSGTIEVPDAAEKREADNVNGPSELPVASGISDQDRTTKVFRFLSTATPETLGGVAVGLAAVTYFILGSLGLLLIGAFAGVVAFIHWEARNPNVGRAVRGERGIDLLERLLAEARGDKQVGTVEACDPDEEEHALSKGFETFQPETSAALNELVDAVIRDYVKWWYAPVLPSDRFFPLACERVLTSFLVSVSSHLSRKRPADAFLDFLTNTSSIVIVFLSELSAAFMDLPTGSSTTAVDAVYNYLASKPDCNLANLLSQRQQAGKFKMVAEDLLQFLERPTYNCDPARVFLREMLAGVALEMSLQTCSKPEWINGWIVYLLEAGEPDFSQAIDVGMQTGPALDNALIGIDGNVGNIGLAKGNRNSFELEKARRKEPTAAHKKKLSKADEEMELAMEEMKRMNEMIAEEETRRKQRPQSQTIGNLGSSVASQAATTAPEKLAEVANVSGVSQKLASSDSPAFLPRNSQRRGNTSNAPSQFTSFDQIVPAARDDPENEDEVRQQPPPLTLHNATITVLDEVGDSRLRSKPNWDYLIQVEPATTHYPGWMIVPFTEQYTDLPSWKSHTRTSLRAELEQYLRQACRFQSLAESEGMRKFLERDNRFQNMNAKSGFQAIEKLGKNVFDVLTSAPLEGSKAVVGGVTGVLGNIGLGQRKNTSSTLPTSPSLQNVTAASRLSMSTPPRMDSSASLRTRDSMDSQRSSVVSTQPGKHAPMERRPSYQSQSEAEPESRRVSRSDQWERPVGFSARSSREHSRASSLAPLRSPSATSLSGIHLPPPPDAMPEDYMASPLSPQTSGGATFQSHSRSQTLPNVATQQSDAGQTTNTNVNDTRGPQPAEAAPQPTKLAGKKFTPLSEQETRVAVELLFAMVNELYTLSSAWNIRRTLLAAAKSFLLRPGNPSLTWIQSMIQSSVIEAHASDGGIASHLRKLRENVLPTEQERASWPAEMTPDEKEALRTKARKMLIERGVPAALTGVMGQNATSEALGRVFDCLQEEKIARGLMFGIMLQAVRIVTH
ncbi:hypothetical protein DL546_009794 [Coniochaeta pulveracea]|uniref:PXA domain-containing protein n=1 Tax=Coniochaeta pulveracea TaxID=177199 RepID=A0A420YP86_9PEZI|nr:hypothetical protein DL546_009794 [Coniochaeta pulveracea]